MSWNASKAGLLPAIHDASIDALSLPLAAAASVEGQVYQNNTGAAVLIPGGLGRRVGGRDYGFVGGVRPKAWAKNSTVSRRERSASARSGTKRTPPPLPRAALGS